MQLILLLSIFVCAMPITRSGWAEGSNVLLDPKLVCNKKSRRGRGKLAEICRNGTNLMHYIEAGINMGFKECEYQFRNRQWNCTNNKRSTRRILMKDSRETAFLNAIAAAGITYKVTRACTMGELVECSCDKNQRRFNEMPIAGLKLDYNTPQRINNYLLNGSTQPKRLKHGKKHKEFHRKQLNGKNKKIGNGNTPLPDGDWEWSGCDENVQFGFKKSEDFLDARLRKRSDIKTLIKLHNNKAGRLAVSNYLKFECQCHGLSGSCTMKTCWKKMPTFREIGNRLKERFDGAVKVIASNDGVSYMPEELTIKPPAKEDLVYTENAIDFCKANHKTGSLGTVGRECNATSQGVDGCDLLCCNRGYDRHIKMETVNCKCQFVWCCKVKCSTCTVKREIFICR